MSAPEVDGLPLSSMAETVAEFGPLPFDVMIIVMLGIVIVTGPSDSGAAKLVESVVMVGASGIVMGIGRMSAAWPRSPSMPSNVVIVMDEPCSLIMPILMGGPDC